MSSLRSSLQPPVTSAPLPPRSTYSPQHPVIDHPQSVFLYSSLCLVATSHLTYNLLIRPTKFTAVKKTDDTVGNRTPQILVQRFLSACCPSRPFVPSRPYRNYVLRSYRVTAVTVLTRNGTRSYILSIVFTYSLFYLRSN